MSAPTQESPKAPESLPLPEAQAKKEEEEKASKLATAFARTTCPLCNPKEGNSDQTARCRECVRSALTAAIDYVVSRPAISTVVVLDPHNAENKEYNEKERGLLHEDGLPMIRIYKWGVRCACPRTHNNSEVFPHMHELIMDIHCFQPGELSSYSNPFITQDKVKRQTAMLGNAGEYNGDSVQRQKGWMVDWIMELGPHANWQMFYEDGDDHFRPFRATNRPKPGQELAHFPCLMVFEGGAKPTGEKPSVAAQPPQPEADGKQAEKEEEEVKRPKKSVKRGWAVIDQALFYPTREAALAEHKIPVTQH